MEGARAAANDAAQQTAAREAEAEVAAEEQQRLEDEHFQKLKEEKAQQELAEYEKWKSEIVFEGKGELEAEEEQKDVEIKAFLRDRAAQVEAHAQQQQQNLNAEVDKHNSNSDTSQKKEDDIHILVLQDAARDLQTSVEKLVSFIEHFVLQQTDLFGVFDDRGKFIFIAKSHFQQIAQFVKRRGRVSVEELARECNRIVLG
ncbi:hypothetical protein STCU_12313 [Strigomonas culicis]|uniref:DDRGK domain-containing protein 1 n=1 Tax=Strigomonas culicis TaxID=28005 RepID=S9UKI7_9TRYP|nr:hypothetical protein STCU_12313 [Strigomonas culicis]|eukprot:EPY15151.1 hypothetical protein STCU_12313 [Strigomonas culicis]